MVLLYLYQGRHEDAKEKAEALFVQSEKVFPPDHPARLDITRTFATTYRIHGNLYQAINY